MMAGFFLVAKLVGWPPLAAWGWVWVFSPLWVDWTTRMVLLWGSRGLAVVVQFAISVMIHVAKRRSSSRNIGLYSRRPSTDRNASASSR